MFCWSCVWRGSFGDGIVSQNPACAPLWRVSVLLFVLICHVCVCVPSSHSRSEWCFLLRRIVTDRSVTVPRSGDSWWMRTLFLMKKLDVQDGWGLIQINDSVTSPVTRKRCVWDLCQLKNSYFDQYYERITVGITVHTHFYFNGLNKF